MMQLERRALYNSLRMNFILDPTLSVESWQVIDYRSLPLESLFQGLERLNIILDKLSFYHLSDEAESPEDLADNLVADSNFSNQDQDKIYLIIFELWRRLIPERMTLSLFCDELDHLIFSHDTGNLTETEAIPDIIANLEIILDENTDDGSNPVEVFQTVALGCANDIESFLYDFIAEQIAAQNLNYASELLEDFSSYVSEVKWFDLLRVQIFSFEDSQAAIILFEQLVSEALQEKDLDYNLELLHSLLKIDDTHFFQLLIKATIPLLEFEDDFRDFLNVCLDYYHHLDLENEENQIASILSKRAVISSDKKLEPKDKDFQQVLQIIHYSFK
ncbi:hypothetical protein BN1013_01279 [Candidatus Rubidus massiliensis]|nr:hypothetical protein BN1013_01279 [Candidatus Rubidus massiliensis]